MMIIVYLLLQVIGQTLTIDVTSSDGLQPTSDGLKNLVASCH